MHRTKAQAMQRPFFLSLLSLHLFSSSDKRWVGKIISKLTNWPIPNIRHTSYFKHLCQGTGHIYFLQQCFLDLLFETILSMETHGGWPSIRPSQEGSFLSYSAKGALPQAQIKLLMYNIYLWMCTWKKSRSSPLY